MKTERGKIILGFAIISLIWGSTWMVIKIGLESIPPLFGIAARFTLASFILLLVVKIRNEPFRFDKKSLSVYFNLALLSFSIPFALVYWGEQYIASGLASVLFAAFPLIVALGSHFFIPAERLDKYKSIGILLGFSGMLTIFWEDISVSTDSMLGMAAVICSTVMQGTSLVILKRGGHHISPTTMSLGGMVLSLAIIYPMAFIFEDISMIRLDMNGVGSVIYLGTFGTVVTFVVYYWLLKRVEAVYLSLVSFITPVIALILGIIILSESISSNIVIGSFFILSGIFVTNFKELNNVCRWKKSVS